MCYIFHPSELGCSKLYSPRQGRCKPDRQPIDHLIRSSGLVEPNTWQNSSLELKPHYHQSVCKTVFDVYLIREGSHQRYYGRLVRQKTGLNCRCGEHRSFEDLRHAGVRKGKVFVALISQRSHASLAEPCSGSGREKSVGRDLVPHLTAVMAGSTESRRLVSALAPVG